MAEKVTVPNEYLNFTDVFSNELAVELLKRSDINKHAIDLKLSKQPFYAPIYSLDPIKLKTLKTYIKTNLINGFI